MGYHHGPHPRNVRDFSTYVYSRVFTIDGKVYHDGISARNRQILAAQPVAPCSSLQGLSTKPIKEFIMTEFTYEYFLSLIKSIKIKLPKFEMPKLKIQDLTARLPIVQGGMGVGISLSGLASAVAESGGIGLIAANGIGLTEADYFKDGRAANIRALRREIREARARTDGIIGVNIMVALNDFHELLDTAIEERVDLIVIGAGLPIKNIPVEKIRENNVKIAPIVSTERAANLSFKMWKRIYNDVPDAVIVEGPEAGGHLGVPEDEIESPAYKLEKVIPEVVESIHAFEKECNKEIPVIAAGGIFTGNDIYKIMNLGARAVQMGTRFVATDECDADPKFKEAYVSARQEDIGIIKSPVGLPGRAIVNGFLKKAATEKQPFKCPWRCLAGCQADDANYCISIALNNARKGRLERGFAFVGTNAYRVEKVVPVSALMGVLETGYVKALFADMRVKAADVIERVKALKEEYRIAEKRLGELKAEYEYSLSEKFRNMREGSASLRQEYKKTAARLAELRLKLTEQIFETYAIIMNG